MKICFYIFCILFLAFCRHPSPSGHKFACGFPYEWLSFDKENNPEFPPDSCFAFFIHTMACNVQNKIIWAPQKEIFPELIVKKNGYFRTLYCILCHFNTGDSIKIILPSNVFFSEIMGHFPSGIQDSLVFLFVKVNRIFSLYEWNKYSDSLIKSEEKNIASLIEQSGMIADSSGIFSSKTLSGHSLPPKPGKQFRIFYGCRTLSGVLLDTTYDALYLSGEDFQHSYFIKNINYVMKRISCPDTVKIIVPSHLAFGVNGFYNIIPPHTPLVYTIVKLIYDEK